MMSSGSPIIGATLIEPGMYDQNMIEGYLYAGLTVGFGKLITDAVEMRDTEPDLEKRRED